MTGGRAPIRVAMVGAGSIAARHLAGLEALAPRCEVVAHATRRAEAAASAAERWGGAGYDDLERMLDEVRPDAAVICVPPNAHGAIERALVERGVHFLVDKPLDADGEIAEATAELLEGSGLVAAVGYQWRALDTLDRVRALVAERGVRLVSGSWLGSLPPPAWWHQRATCGGQVVEQATHMVDLARHLVGEAVPVAALAADTPGTTEVATDVNTVTSALVRYEGGAVGTFTATCVLATNHVTHLRLAMPGALVTITQQEVEFAVDGTTTVVATSRDPFEAQLDRFLAAIEHGDPSRVTCSYGDALRTHRLCLDIERLADAAVPA